MQSGTVKKSFKYIPTRFGRIGGLAIDNFHSILLEK